MAKDHSSQALSWARFPHPCGEGRITHSTEEQELAGDLVQVPGAGARLSCRAECVGEEADIQGHGSLACKMTLPAGASTLRPQLCRGSEAKAAPFHTLPRGAEQGP